MNVFRIKKISDVKNDAGKTALKKNLGALDLVMLGLGGIIGTGIFVLTGLAAAKYAGPAITLSFLLGAIACIFTALAYAELASMLPVAGSAYSYAYVTLGELAAVIIGWKILMVFTYGAATVAAGWSGYIVGLLGSVGIQLPDQIVKIPSQGGLINLPAVLIIVLLSALLVKGTKEATKLNGILVVVKLAAIFIFVLAAVPHVDSSHWQVFSPHGFFGIAAGAGFIFMAYTGFDTLATAAEECRNPNRDLPIGIIGSLVGSAILYVLVSGLLTAIVPYSSLNNPEPMAHALRFNGVQIGAAIVATGAIAGMTTVLLTQIYGQSRILFVMARDGLLPKYFMKVHPRFSTPYIGVLFSGVIMLLIAGFVPVSTLGQLSSMSTLVVFAFVSLAVMIVRYKKPNEKRTFKCPAVYVVASISVGLCLFLFTQLLRENWAPYLASSLIGPIIYFLYGYRNSVMNRQKMVNR
jgi:APA family basic amino acid/polyamine antiporter